ncbi:hypothetical protein ACO0LF_14160 [Undibacterium sp. Di27W]|uniref:hypothetical protein n=1 Tax=Undibacterium sp. Di27W TaxID=3413036 RepID=UPI003BF07260
MEKEGPLFERSEFRAFPFFVPHKREPPLGGGYAWVAFLAHLFGEAKRWVAAGLPPACNRKYRFQTIKDLNLKQQALASAKR